MNFEIDIKALSVNIAWQGRRFKTKNYLNFETEILLLLPKHVKIKGEVEIHYTFYLKNYALSDVDNLIKPLQDCLVKGGLIEDDRKIVFLSAEKRKSKRNYIEVEINKYEG